MISSNDTTIPSDFFALEVFFRATECKVIKVKPISNPTYGKNYDLFLNHLKNILHFFEGPFLREGEVRVWR